MPALVCMGIHFRAESSKPGSGESLSICGRCGSQLVQQQGWKELTSEFVLVYLRCPECFHLSAGSVRHEVLAEYDEALVDSRNAIKAQYEAIVRQNMGELVERFVRALELDLIAADDFCAA